MSDLSSNTSLIFQIQEQTSNIIINGLSSLSSELPVYPEDSKNIEYEIKNALGKQGIVAIVLTPTLNYIGDYNDNTDKRLAFECPDLTILITENVMVNRSNPNSKTSQDYACDIARILGVDHRGQYSVKSIETGEDGNLLTSKITLKCYIVDDYSAQ